MSDTETNKTETVFEDDMLQFFTRDAGNEGVTFPLLSPIDNADTGHWLKVLSVDSDAYAKANTAAMRKAVAIAKIEDEVKREEAVNEQTLNILSALVVDWSFKKPCTPQNVREFLTSAPQIKNAINRISADRSLFMKSSSDFSIDTLKPASDSTESQSDPQ